MRQSSSRANEWGEPSSVDNGKVQKRGTLAMKGKSVCIYPRFSMQEGKYRLEIGTGSTTTTVDPFFPSPPDTKKRLWRAFGCQTRPRAMRAGPSFCPLPRARPAPPELAGPPLGGHRRGEKAFRRAK